MTNGQLTAVLATLVGLVILVLAYPSIEDSMRPELPPYGECHAIIDTAAPNPNVAAPYIQTECD